MVEGGFVATGLHEVLGELQCLDEVKTDCAEVLSLLKKFEALRRVLDDNEPVTIRTVHQLSPARSVYVEHLPRESQLGVCDVLDFHGTTFRECCLVAY